MGTRADFYVGRGADAEWLGSIAMDGYPEGISPRGADKVRGWFGMEHPVLDWPKGEHLFDATTEQEFRDRLERYFQFRDDVTRPAEGWPWPWENSQTTDYAYAFDGGTVYASCFGHAWFVAAEGEPELGDDEPRGKPTVFPDMRDRKNVQWGSKSGLIFLGG